MPTNVDVDDGLLSRARTAAEKHGISLEELREYANAVDDAETAWFRA